MAEGRATEVLLRAMDGSPGAAEELYALVYQELRRMAESRMRRERPDHTLQATELVHEVYLRLIDVQRCQVRSRGQFFALAGRAMRHVLVDHARRRGARKRGGGLEKLPLDAALDVAAGETDAVLLALGDALDRLETLQPEMARVVEMLYFAGLTQEDAAELLGISRRTVCRRWEYARAWLHREMGAGRPPA
jgi:RNA polymerase sigma factor (TIGR02999 family)